MINIAQDNNISAQTLDELFKQEEESKILRNWLNNAETAKPIKMAQPVEKAPTAGELLVAYLESIIDKRVEEKVSQIMSSHATMALISQEQREIVDELVQEAIDVHLSDIDHDEFCTVESAQSLIRDAIGDMDIDTAVTRVIQRTTVVEDIVDSRLEEEFDDKFAEKIDEIDWEEKVREGLTSIIG